MHSGRLACAPRVSLRTLPLALTAAFALTCPPSTFATECTDVRTGRAFAIPSVRYTAAGEPDSTTAMFGGLCVGAVRSTHAVPVSDGNGGAYVVWVESAGSDCDLRVQRVGAGGNPADGWPEGGRQLCAAPGTQTQPAVAPAGDGGAWFAWKDFREPHQSAIYLARLDATGSPVSALPEGGVLVSNAGSAGSDPTLTSDGSSGVWLVWQQGRPGARSLRLKHFGEDGALAPGWPAEGRTLTDSTTDAVRSVAAADPSGGFYLVWVKAIGTGGETRMARFDAAGAPSAGWSSEGVALASSPGFLLPGGLGVDADGAFVAWSEHFEDSTAARFLRVRGSGSTAAGWPAGGLALASSSTSASPAISPDGAGGAYVAWVGTASLGDPFGLRLGRVDVSGALVSGWLEEGVLVPNTGPGVYRPRLLPVDDGVLVSWSASGGQGEGTILSAAMANLGALPALERVEKWPDLVRLAWRMSSDAAYETRVERCGDDGIWLPLGILERDAEGRLRLEDREVVAGEALTYRLRLRSSELEIVTGEARVEVPSAVPLTLKGVVVEGGRLRLVASVPMRGESRFELFDVQGRRLLRDIRQHEHAGEVKLDWPVPAGVRAGVFFARFSQGRETKTRRFVLGR